MNNFTTYIIFQNTVAEYEIYKKGEKFKALLIIDNASAHLPQEISFWKESGQWRSSHMLNEHALYQFGYHIDNQVLSATIQQLKAVAA